MSSMYLDGILKTVAILLSDVNYIPMFGAISFEKDVGRPADVLTKHLKTNLNLDTSSIKYSPVKWEVSINTLFNTWCVDATHNLNVDSFSSLSTEHQEEIFGVISDYIKLEINPIDSFHVVLNGSSWEYDAEGIILECEKEKSLLLYFMWSD